MRILFLFSILFFSLNAKELDVIKYIEDNAHPKIAIEYKNIDVKLLSLLKMDFNVISHFDYKVLKPVNDYLKKPNVSKYKGFNYLLRMNFHKKNNIYILNVFLYDLFNKKIIFAKQYKINKYMQYVLLTHTLSYEINKALNMPPVDWIKRFVVYSIYTAPKESEIYISDYSFRYQKRIIKGGLNIFPLWEDKKQTKILFTSLNSTPTLYEYNIYTGKKKKILSSEGMLVASDIRGDKLLFTMSPNDQPDIYLMNLKTKKYKRVTFYKGIDVSGNFLDDNKIVFISDRLGYPNIYVKKIDDKYAQRIVYHGKNHVALTTYKNMIVYSSRETANVFAPNTFNLFLTSLDDDTLIRLTTKGKNMFPKFSKDGDTIMFIKTEGFRSDLSIIRLKEKEMFYFPLKSKLQAFDW